MKMRYVETGETYLESTPDGRWIEKPVMRLDFDHTDHAVEKEMLVDFALMAAGMVAFYAVAGLSIHLKEKINNAWENRKEMRRKEKEEEK